MARLFRKAVGLIAAYAIALQALLSGVLVAAYANADPFLIICTSDNSGHSGNLPQQADHDCVACVLSCGATPASSGTTISPVALAGRARQQTLWFEQLP